MQFLRRSCCHAVKTKNLAITPYATIDAPKLEEQPWSTSIAEAEKVVGYPTSFLNLRWLLSDEVANVATHVRKLFGTNHPLLSITKDLVMNSEKPSWGLIVLLVSKAGGHDDSISVIDKDLTAGVLHSQRILGEVTEMIRTSNLLHKGLITIDEKVTDVETMNFGNKIALLSGDYLLSNSYHQLACLKNFDLDDLISSTLRDLAECEFIEPRDKHNKPLPSRPNLDKKEVSIPDDLGNKPLDTRLYLGNAKTEWLARNILGGASLLGKSCQGVLLLAGHGQRFQRSGYILGKYLALSLKAGNDYNSVINNKDLSLVSAPVLFHLQRYPDFYTEFEHLIYKDSIIAYEKIRNILLESPALNDTKLLQHELSERTLNTLEDFKDSDAKEALRNIVVSAKL